MQIQSVCKPPEKSHRLEEEKKIKKVNETPGLRGRKREESNNIDREKNIHKQEKCIKFSHLTMFTTF